MPEPTFSPSVHAPTTPQPHPQPLALATTGSAAHSFSDMVTFMREERETMEVKMREQREEMEAKLEEQRQQTEQLRQELSPQEAISAAQVEALTARLEALHAAQLLSDDEMFGLEDAIGDFVEARASFGMVTMETVHTNRVVGKMHKLVAVSEGMPKDAMLARQLRRKFA